LRNTIETLKRVNFFVTVRAIKLNLMIVRSSLG